MFRILGGVALCVVAILIWAVVRLLPMSSGIHPHEFLLAIALPVMCVFGLWIIAAGAYDLLKGRFDLFTDASGLHCKLRGRWVVMNWNEVTRIEIHSAPGVRRVLFKSLENHSWLMLSDEHPLDELLDEVRLHLDLRVICKVPHASDATMPPFK